MAWVPILSHDVRLAGQNLLAVAEGRPSIRCPGHLPYVLGASDSLDAQARGELRRLRAQTGDQLVAGGEEGASLFAAQFADVALEVRRAFVGGRHPAT